MSFAPGKKDKKPGKAPSKGGPPKGGQQTQEAVRDRVVLLEEIVSKLRLQHEMFQPLLELLTKASDVMELEEQAKAFLEQASALEEKIALQRTQTGEIEKKTTEISVPSALSEGQGTASRVLPQMMSAVGEIESNVQAIATRRRATAKRHEDSSKDQFSSSLDPLKSDLAEMQALLKEKTGKFLKENQEKINALEEKGSQLKQRQKQDQALIEEALEKNSRFGGEAGESWLREELNIRVKEALDDLSKYLDYNYRQLEVLFKQSLLSLKNTYHRVLNTYYTVTAEKKAPDAVNGRVEGIQNLEDKLEAGLRAQTATLKDVAGSLHESIGQLEDKAVRFNRMFRTVEDEERAEMTQSGRPDFEQWLQTLWHNVDLLRENFEQLEANTTADATKITDFLQFLQTNATPKHDELAPKANAVKNSAGSKIAEARSLVQELLTKLFSVWKAINAITDWNIEFVEKKPGDSEGFQGAPVFSLSGN